MSAAPASGAGPTPRSVADADAPAGSDAAMVSAPLLASATPALALGARDTLEKRSDADVFDTLMSRPSAAAR